MDLVSLRSLALSTLQSVFGVDVTVTPVDGDPVSVTGVWMTPAPTDGPLADLKRRDRRRVMVFRRTDVPTLQRGSLVQAAELGAADVADWRVDGFEVIDAEQIRAVLVPVTE